MVEMSFASEDSPLQLEVVSRSPGDARLKQLALWLVDQADRRSVCGLDYPFSDPAWNIMLWLYGQADNEPKRSTKTLGVVSQVPQTTALRNLYSLQTRGLIDRYGSSDDLRRVYARLTPKAVASLTAWLQTYAEGVTRISRQMEEASDFQEVRGLG